MSSEDTACVPEWCDGEEGHSPTCPNHLLDEGPITKARFVEITESAAQHAIESYRTLTEDTEEDGIVFVGDALTPDEAAECAIDGVVEASTCYVGIGSCGRGWCKHS